MSTQLCLIKQDTLEQVGFSMVGALSLSMRTWVCISSTHIEGVDMAVDASASSFGEGDRWTSKSFLARQPSTNGKLQIY